MKVKAVSDDKILEITDFKRVGDELVKTKKKKGKKSKSAKESPKANEPSFGKENLDFEDEMILLLEENEILHTELVKERVRRQTIEKLLNKLLKQQQDISKGKDE